MRADSTEMIESAGKYYDHNKWSVQLLKHCLVKKIALSLFVTKMGSGSFKAFVTPNLQLLANAVNIDSDSSSSIDALLQSESCLLSYWKQLEKCKDTFVGCI